MADEASRVNEASLNIFFFEPRVAAQKSLRQIARRQHAENVFHSQPTAANDWLAPENLRIVRDSLQQFDLRSFECLLSNAHFDVSLLKIQRPAFYAEAGCRSRRRRLSST